MPASNEKWDWKCSDPAKRTYNKLQPHEQERIVSKLDDIAFSNLDARHRYHGEMISTAITEPRQPHQATHTRVNPTSTGFYHSVHMFVLTSL